MRLFHKSEGESEHDEQEQAGNHSDDLSSECRLDGDEGWVGGNAGSHHAGQSGYVERSAAAAGAAVHVSRTVGIRSSRRGEGTGDSQINCSGGWSSSSYIKADSDLGSLASLIEFGSGGTGSSVSWEAHVWWGSCHANSWGTALSGEILRAKSELCGLRATESAGVSTVAVLGTGISSDNQTHVACASSGFSTGSTSQGSVVDFSLWKQEDGAETDEEWQSGHYSNIFFIIKSP